MKKRIAAVVLCVLTVYCCASCAGTPDIETEPPVPAPTQPVPAPPPAPAEQPDTEPVSPEEPEQQPQAPVPTFEQALTLIEEQSPEAQSMLAGGFEPVDHNETVSIHGELCRQVELFRDADGVVSRSHFAAGALGGLYYAPDPVEEWYPLNGQAMVFAGAGEEDLFFVATDDWATEYEDHIKQAQSVSTPVVGLEIPKPIVVVALKEGLRLRVELDFDAAPDVFYDEVMTRGQAIAVSAELSPENSVLRLVGAWQKEGTEYTAVWYANWQDGMRDYIAYIPAE